MKRKTIILFLLIYVSSVFAEDRPRFASIFTDNLVFQQKASSKIWGFASPNEKLRLKCSWLNSDLSIIASSDGTWQTYISTPCGSMKPEYISLKNTEGDSAILQNVLIGEVWLCSGQSNMEMVLQNHPENNMFVEGSKEAIAKSENPYIRFINIQRKESFYPVKEIAGYSWKTFTPDNVKWLSAVAFFFGERLYNELKIPVGLIVSVYGGSPVQSWIPSRIIESKGIYGKDKADLNAEIAASSRSESEYIRLMSEWLAASEKHIKPNDTVSLYLPVDLEKSPVGNQMGEVSFSKEIYLTNIETGNDMHVNLGIMNDFGQVYFNGEKVWEELRNSRSYSKVEFTIPASKLNNGKNLIEARVLNVLWGGGLTGPAEKMYYELGNGPEKNSLAGNWKFRKLFDLSDVAPVPLEGKPLFSNASALYNGMISPLVGYGIKGCLWYQGEANVDDAEHYYEMFTDMIHSWRKDFGHNFPFYYVQIAPYRYAGNSNNKALELREAQKQIEKDISNTGMVVTSDIGNPANIHPAKKREVGNRLADMVLSDIYGKVRPCRSPEPVTAYNRGNTVLITLKNVYNGIKFNGEKHSFELSPDGITYFPATVYYSNRQLILFSGKVSNPLYVRYCWDDSCKSTVLNSAGLPLSSFCIPVEKAKNK